MLAKSDERIFTRSAEVERAVVVNAFAAGWSVLPEGGHRIVLIFADEEDVWWARGWNTKAARALRVSAALS